jgi:dipeptidase D
MSNAIEGLKPQLVWKYFAEIARIPRGSKNEAAISKHVYETAGKLGLQAKQDALGNVVVRKPASPGKQNVRPICLQGHLDMVCEKNAGKVHDFMKDPIELVRKGDVLTANGTTLGADNGIAVATNLAIMEDKTLEHGPLELLFTIDEETGLTGASNLAADFLESRTLLNLDSEDEGELFVGCAGGKDTLGAWKADFEPAPEEGVAMSLKVLGLRGGHSGIDIAQGRGNAIKIANRVILELTARGARLSSINGGNKRNAIPRECEAVLFIPRKKLEKAKKIAAQYHETVRAEFATVEKDLSIALTEMPQAQNGRVLKKTLQKKLCRTIAALPHGVIKMSADIPGLVETSTNVAVVGTTADAVSLATSQRSSVASEIDEIVQTVTAVLELGGADVETSDGYPGWKPNLASPILKLAADAYKSLFGKEPEVKAIHAGLECGILGERVPGLDMVSFGPTLRDVHTPDEKIHIDSVEKFWKFLLAILKNVK